MSIRRSFKLIKRTVLSVSSPAYRGRDDGVGQDSWGVYEPRKVKEGRVGEGVKWTRYTGVTSVCLVEFSI